MEHPGCGENLDHQGHTNQVVEEPRLAMTKLFAAMDLNGGEMREESKEGVRNRMNKGKGRGVELLKDGGGSGWRPQWLVVGGG